MRLTKDIHLVESGAIHYWRVEMRGSKGVVAAYVGVTDQLMKHDPAAARSDVAARLMDARRDMRRVYETTSPLWANIN